VSNSAAVSNQQQQLVPFTTSVSVVADCLGLQTPPGRAAQAQRCVVAAVGDCAGVVNFVDARTKWFDQHVQEAVTQHGIHQVVVVAAGFDTRAYRWVSGWGAAATSILHRQHPMCVRRRPGLIGQCPACVPARKPPS
jgi:O-methyltransferase involved in polyketide biosynthesis